VLADAGARPQRVLWASTGTKNPDYSDVKYVEELAAPGVVGASMQDLLAGLAPHRVHV
jgi:transaldolase